MKIVKTIIKPERFEFVKKALEDKGLKGMTIPESKVAVNRRKIPWIAAAA